MTDVFKALRPLEIKDRKAGSYYSLAALEGAGLGRVSRLPVSIRVMLESLLRNVDGERVTEQHVRELAAWQPNAERTKEVPFVVARLIAPDASGIPLLADLAAMRDAARKRGMNAGAIEPLVTVDLIVDHSLIVERSGNADALIHNMKSEFSRNVERYGFLKWAASAFKGFKIVPPGIGIIHQVNIEHLARGVWNKDGVFYPDSLVGTDSHTSMANGIGVLGWGVGGIEAEAAMLGLPSYLLTPDVVGVELRGAPKTGVTSTDVVLTVVEALRAHKVVGKFVEFFGDGAAQLSAPDRCTISNMAPEYGATAAYFPVDEQTLAYLESAGRTDDELDTLAAYFKAQGMFGMPETGDIDYSEYVRIDLDKVVPSVAGPSRPQDRIALSQLKPSVAGLFTGGSASNASPRASSGLPSDGAAYASSALSNGDIVIAAITSCSNTSNPGVMLAAGLLARKAVQRGLRVHPRVKTSLTPGSRVVSAYLEASGLQPYLDQLGFQVAGYGCATCMGNSGPLPAEVEKAIADNDLVVASVLSGNRNFEARIHQAVKANFLMSPPLVVAFAIAGRIDLDVESEPLGHDGDGRPVYLRNVWPSPQELDEVMPHAKDPRHFRRLYSESARENALWNELPAPTGETFDWNPDSTYLQRPPFFDQFEMQAPPVKPLIGARALAVLGDSVTTDHVSPGAVIRGDSDAGRFLTELGVPPHDFNSYISRRGHHGVMMRGTFANVRLRNQMVPGVEGGVTLHQPDGKLMSIYEAAMTYARENVPVVVFAGEEYGTGSSRDWAAKGPRLLGVRAVIARGFERIHRSNLVGMGILPCQFMGEDSTASLGITGAETFELVGVEHGIEAQQTIELIIHRPDGGKTSTRLLVRVDTPIEETYFRHGGILPYVLRQLLKSQEVTHAS